MNCYEEIVKSKDINKLNQIYKNFGTLGSEVEYVRINLRDNVFLYNICRGYEEKKHLKKPFFILVGSNHVPFLKLNLRAQGYVVKVRDDNHGEKSEL